MSCLRVSNTHRGAGPDPDRLALAEPTVGKVLASPRRRPPRHRPGEEFLAGPVPLAWLRVAAIWPGRALAVGIALWFKAGVSKRAKVKLTSRVREKVGLSRHSTHRGLAALEQAGLVDVDRQVGRSPVVTIRGRRRDEP